MNYRHHDIVPSSWLTRLVDFCPGPDHTGHDGMRVPVWSRLWHTYVPSSDLNKIRKI